MAPKKKEQQKMSLGDFLTDSNFGGSWADEVEDTYGTQPLPPTDRPGRSGGFGSGPSWGSSGGDRGSYAPRERMFPTEIPDKPPYTAHLGNLSYDATVDTVNEFFEHCEIISVRIIEDREQQRPKGFAYAEFASAEGLKRALNLDGDTFQGRGIRVKIADPPRGGAAESNRDLSDWSRKGPLPDAPTRGGGAGGDRRYEFAERRGPREPRDPADEPKPARDFTWERKGPLSPLAQQENAPETARDSSANRAANGGRSESYRGGDRRHSPASWGEGQAPRQEGSRPPRREFAERPERPERVPTAAEKDNQWRSNMRPDAPAKASPAQSREGSEAPTSPAPSAAAPVSAAPASRPKLNLAKRTVSEAPDAAPSAAGDAKSSPFGAARPINTAQREREIEQKKEQQAKEKREADEKAKEERRLAKEAAAKEAAEAAEKAEQQGEAAAETPATEAAVEQAKGEEDGAAAAAAAASDKIPVRGGRGPREGAPPIKTRPSETATSWRSASNEVRSPRGGGGRGGRGGAPRGPRGDGPRGPRANGSPAAAAAQEPPTPSADTEPSTPVVDEDGWTTVPKKGRGRV